MLEAGGTCEFSAKTLRSNRRGAHVSPASARASDPAAPPSGITQASDDAASPMRTGKTHRLKAGATWRGHSEGLPVPRSRRCFLREARMAKRRKHRASEGLEGRSECPETGMGSPEPDIRARIKCGPYEPCRTRGGNEAARRPDSEKLRADAGETSLREGRQSFQDALLGPGRRKHAAHRPLTSSGMLEEVPLAGLSLNSSAAWASGLASR